ncbi:hypothetical protein [Variovorax sp. E3]|uniref:hypothetical protein n=1 Tax=Variovorax sp. E3 TaxID=1914993 RepID=UPI0018DD4BA6|nr:hypothetical protein [Variovorax sp. E3]
MLISLGKSALSAIRSEPVNEPVHSMRHLPNLYRNRYGVYYLRLYHERRETKISLRTKDWSLAKLLALQHHHRQAMAGIPRRYEANLETFEFKTDGTPEDAVALERFLANPAIAYRLQQPPAARAPVSHAPTSAPILATPKTFVEFTKAYLLTKDNQNTNKTLAEKKTNLRRVFTTAL